MVAKTWKRSTESAWCQMLLGYEPIEPHRCLLDDVVSRWKSQRTFYCYHREKSFLFLCPQLKYCPFLSVTRKCITSPSTPQQSYRSTDTSKQEGTMIKQSFWPTSRKIFQLLFSTEVECTYGSEGELILSCSVPFVLQSHLIIWYKFHRAVTWEHDLCFLGVLFY